MTPRRRRGGTTIALVVVVILLVTGGLVIGGRERHGSDAEALTSPGQLSVGTAEPRSDTTVPPAPAAAGSSGRVDGAAPEQVTLPSVGIDALVTSYTDADVAANDGWVDPPTPDAVSWWAGGGTPATDADNTVYLYGHVSRGPAAFNSLHEVEPGTLVVVRTAHGTLRYSVTEVLEPIAKEALPHDARVVAAVPGRLVLIGCHRDADQGTRPTTHNTVVIAQLATARSIAV